MDKIHNFFKIANNKGLTSQTFVYLDEKEKAQLQISFAQDENQHLDINIKIKKIFSFNANARHSYFSDKIYTKYNLLNKVYEKQIDQNLSEYFDPMLLIFTDYANAILESNSEKLTDITSNKSFRLTKEGNQILLHSDKQSPIQLVLDGKELAYSFQFEVSGLAKFHFVRQD